MKICRLFNNLLALQQATNFPNGVLLIFAAFSMIALPFVCPAQTFKADNNELLNVGTSWVDVAAPSSNDVAAWDATVATAANCTNTLSSSVNWAGILVANPAAPVKILTNNSPVISLGAAGINLSNATAGLWVSSALTTTANQTWIVTNGLTLILGEAGRNVTIANNVVLAGTVLFPNAIVVSSSGLLMIPNGASLGSTITNNATTSMVVNGMVTQTGGSVTVGRSDSTSGSPKATLSLVGTGIYNFNGGSFVDDSTTRDGRLDVGTSTGNLGTLNINGNASMQLQSLYIANGGSGMVNVTNGNLNVTVNAIRIGTGNNGGTGTMNVYGGTVSAAAGINVQHSTSADADTGILNLYDGSIFVGGVLNVPNGIGVGTVNLDGGLLVVTNNLNLPNNVGGTGTVNLAGGTLVTSEITRTAAGTGILVFNGGTLKPAASNPNFVADGIALDVSTNGAVVDTANFDVSILSPLLNGTGGGADGGLLKLGPGSLTLAGTNTYTGPTVISAGTLVLSSSNPVADSTNIVIGGPSAMLNVFNLSSPLILGAGQTLTLGGASGGVSGTLDGGLNMGAGSLTVNYTNGSPVLAVINGTFAMNNNAVDVTVSGAPLSVGNYLLITAAVPPVGTAGSVDGSLSNSLLTVSGAGIVNGATASLQITNAGLYLVVASSNSISTTTTLQSSANPSSYGKIVTFTATINPAPTNGEAVIFKAGSATLGAGTLIDGVAAFATSTLVSGSHLIVAVYGGDDVYLNSTDAVTQIVQPSLADIILQGDTNVVFHGSSGLSNGLYFVLSSTNLALPLTNWTMIGSSNWFDENGDFNFTNAVNPALTAQFYALSMKSQNLTLADSIILQALQNMRDEGFNTYLPPPGGLWVNWIYTNIPPVLQSMGNINYDGTPDPDPTTRHDRLTDIDYLAALCLYKKLHPLDTQFDAEISRYTNICQGATGDNFLASPDQRGWVYWAIEDVTGVVPAFVELKNAQADKYYNLYTNHLAKYGQVMPLYWSIPADELAGTYRGDLLVEDACVLIVNGHERGLADYVSAGEALMAFAQSNAYSQTLKIWADTMGHLFTDTNRTAVSSSSQQYIYDTTINTSEIGEILDALCRADPADPGKGYGLLAKATLDKMVPATNAFGLWDASHGGYYSNLILSGTNVQSPGLSASVNTSYKQVGRAAVMIQAYLSANQFAAGSYDTNTLDAINTANLNSYYSAGHGWPFQENVDYSVYLDHVGNQYIPQTWVTSEAISHAVRALLKYKSGSP